MDAARTGFTRLPQTIETVLFDFGGTLDADGVAWKERFHALYEAEGLVMTADAFAPVFYAADDPLVGGLAPTAGLEETVGALAANIETQLERFASNDRVWHARESGRPDLAGVLIAEASAPTAALRAVPLPAASRQGRIQRAATAAHEILPCEARQGDHPKDRGGGAAPIAANAWRNASCRTRRSSLPATGQRFARSPGRCRLGIVSNFYGNLEAVCESAGLAPLFGVMADSHRVGAEKPDPAIFRVALDALGAAPETTLYVGDSFRRDCEGARRAGLSFVWIAPKGAGAQADAAAPVAATLSELPQLLDLLQ